MSLSLASGESAGKSFAKAFELRFAVEEFSGENVGNSCGRRGADLDDWAVEQDGSGGGGCDEGEALLVLLDELELGIVLGGGEVRFEFLRKERGDGSGMEDNLRIVVFFTGVPNSDSASSSSGGGGEGRETGRRRGFGREVVAALDVDEVFFCFRVSL